mmetsp:Transcript_98427/g.287039  ORF Transcript_98427/g.287039 Transcript_98427/m.287039 type:complete len:290 (+) Transcript_98427:2277-3146(+)
MAVFRELLLLVRFVLVTAKDGSGALRGDGRVVGLGQHANLVAHGNGQGTPGTTFADNDGDHGDLQARHGRKVCGNGLALPGKLRSKGGPSTDGVYKREHWQAKALCCREKAQRRAVARRGWHCVVEVLALRGCVALLALHDEDASAALQCGKAAPQALVQAVGPLAITPQLCIGRAHLLNDVICIIPVKKSRLCVVHGRLAWDDCRHLNGLLRPLGSHQHAEDLPGSILKLIALYHHIHLSMHEAKLIALELVWARLVVSTLVHTKLRVQDDLGPRETQAPLGHANSHI